MSKLAHSCSLTMDQIELNDRIDQEPDQEWEIKGQYLKELVRRSRASRWNALPWLVRKYWKFRGFWPY